MVDIKKGVIEYSNNSINMEKERRKSLEEGANFNTATISILLGVTITLIFELLDRLSKIDYLIIIFGCILVVLLLGSLFFSLQSNWFYKKKFTRSGKDLIDYINSNFEQYQLEDGFLDQRINDNDEILLSLEENNNKRLRSIMVSSILLYIYLGLIIAFGIVILIVL